MKAVFGLGNPGIEYALTRHNVGFQVVDLYRKVHRIREKGKITDSSLVYRTRGLLLVKPLTYMNASGEAVKAVLKQFQILPEAALIIYDDLDLPLGRMKILPGGGAGTHKGMISILSAVGGEGIPRLRVGIGTEPRPQETVSYVLDRFTPGEWKELLPVLHWAVEAIEVFCSSGIDTAMNRFNRREKQVAKEGNTGIL